MDDTRFLEACNRLRDLCIGSTNTEPATAKFRVHRLYCRSELSRLESELGLALPESYRVFLTIVGSATCYENSFGQSVRFLGPEHIREWMDQVFAGLSPPYPELLLVVSDGRDGSHCGFNRRPGCSRPFGIFDPARPCEDWLDQEGPWRRFEEWLPEFVQSGGNSWAAA